MTPQEIAHSLIELRYEQNYLNGILDTLEGVIDLLYGQLDKTGAIWSGNIKDGDFHLDLVQDDHMVEATILMNVAQAVRGDIIKFRELSNDNKKHIRRLEKQKSETIKHKRYRRLG